MPIVGLNLGNYGFRAVELEKRKDQIFVTHFGQYESPKLNLETDSREALDQYAQALSHFFAEVGFSTPEVAVGLSDTSIFMRIVKMPMMNDKELKNAINFEAEQYIPIPLKDINLSYQRLEPDLLDKTHVDVLIVAAKKITVEKYVSVLRKARLVPRAIEPETVALARILGDTRTQPAATVVLDTGLLSTIITVVYSGSVRFSRSVPIGGATFTKAIQQGLDLDELQSEEYKKVYGLDQYQVEGKVYAVLKPIVDNLITEINRVSIFFSNHNANVNIKRVILNGGSALMPGLLLYLASKLDYEVELANPLKTIQVSPKIEDKRALLIEQGPVFCTAFGLALRELTK